MKTLYVVGGRQGKPVPLLAGNQRPLEDVMLEQISYILSLEKELTPSKKHSRSFSAFPLMASLLLTEVRHEYGYPPKP